MPHLPAGPDAVRQRHPGDVPDGQRNRPPLRLRTLPPHVVVVERRRATGRMNPAPCVDVLLTGDPWWVAEHTWSEAASMVDEAPGTEDAWTAGEEAHCHLLREVFGNPFRPMSVHPARLKANKGRARELAWAIYENRDFGRTPELAEALEAASCHDTALLSHLRSASPHVRGCFAVDAVLGRT